jgi:NAD(P)-dependent dehydrogenase (short-subunit alcohol dehydrogenase family)
MMKEFESATPAAVLEAAAQPIGRRSTPEEQAGGLVLLNSDLASFVNGVCLPVDGGFMGGVATGQIDLSVMMAGAQQQQQPA